MAYEVPSVVEYGSIAEHTFLRSVGGTPPKDRQVCKTDKFGDYSCPDGDGEPEY